VTLLLVAAGLRFWDLGGQSLWYDEAYTWWVSTQVSRTEALVSSLREVIPPLSYFAWRLWASLTGTSELALRAAAALAGVLTVAALGATARRLTRSAPSGIAALVLAAVAPPLVWASREVRMYGLLLAFVALGDWALAEVLFGPTRQRRRFAWAWGAAAAAALLTVVLAGFWLVGLGCFTLVVLLAAQDRARRRAIVAALWPPALAAALAFLTWMLPALPHLQANRGYWPGTLTAAEFFRRTVRGVTLFDAAGPEETALRTGIALVGVSLLLPLLVRRRQAGAIFALATTVPPLLLASAAFYRVPKWNLQHTAVFAPGVLLGLAAALPPLVAPLWPSRRPGRAAGPRLLAVTVVLAAAGTLAWATARLLTDPALAHDDWRGLVAYVEAQRSAGEVVVIEAGAVKQSWLYYGGDDGLLPLPDDPLLDVTNVLHYANAAPALNAALARAPGAWVVGWLADVTDPTDIVGTLLDYIGDPVDVPQFHGLRLRRYTLTRPPEFGALPATTAQPDVEMLPGIRLWGATLPAAPVPADAALAVRAWWTAADPEAHAGRCYLASVRVYDRLGNRWGVADGPAAGGDLRAEHWPPGERVLGRYDVTLLPGAPSGTYTVTLMLYELRTEVPSTELALGSVAVGRPSTVPAPDAPFEPVTAVLSPTVAGPLDLLGAVVETASVRPCDGLQGWLYWEVKSPLAVNEAMRITLAESTVTLGARDVFPTQWELGDRFLTLFRLPVDCRALRSRAPVVVSLLQGEDGELAEVAAWAGPEVEVVVERAFEAPTGLTPARLTVGEGVAELLGFRLEPEPVRAGEPFRLVLVWQAGTPTETPYSVFVHVVPRGETGPLAGQHDAWPALGGKPTYTWVPGEVVTDPHDLSGLPPGDYDLRVGMYGPDLVRLPLTHGGAPVQDDVFVLATITVE